MLDHIALLENLAVDPVEANPDIVGDAAVMQRLGQRLIAVKQADILAHHRDGDLALGLADALDDGAPALQVRGRGIEVKVTADHVVHALLVIADRHLINGVHVERGDHRIGGNIAEQGDLAALAFRDIAVAAAHQHVGLDADAQQFLDRMLGRLGLQFTGRGNIGHQGQMDEHHPLAAQLVASRNGRLSISPTVPPISHRQKSSSVRSLLMNSLMASVTWGITCTVAPR